MKKLILYIALVLFTVNQSTAQSGAADFTAVDCNGNNHRLFNELNQGKVIVLVWVMPCATCINDAKGAYEAAQSFETSTPGKVAYYMIDDIGNISCTTLTNWANTNGIKPNVTFFRNEGNVIDEANFGGTGMPHVVVVGPDKQIYFNVRNGSNNRQKIQDAIGVALTKVSVEEAPGQKAIIEIYPNPAKENITITYNLQSAEELNFEIYNMLGESILYRREGIKNSGQQISNIDINELNNGIYLLKIQAGKSIQLKRFVVAK